MQHARGKGPGTCLLAGIHTRWVENRVHNLIHYVYVLAYIYSVALLLWN